MKCYVCGEDMSEVRYFLGGTFSENGDKVLSDKYSTFCCSGRCVFKLHGELSRNNIILAIGSESNPAKRVVKEPSEEKFNSLGKAEWRTFDEERPYGKRHILVTDGKHMGTMALYKEDWLKEWDNTKPCLEAWPIICDMICNCEKSFIATHWMYTHDLLAQLEGGERMSLISGPEEKEELMLCYNCKGFMSRKVVDFHGCCSYKCYYEFYSKQFVPLNAEWSIARHIGEWSIRRMRTDEFNKRTRGKRRT